MLAPVLLSALTSFILFVKPGILMPKIPGDPTA